MTHDAPTPETNAARIDGAIVAISELRQSQENSLKELRESEEKNAKTNRYVFIAVLGIITSAAGFWGSEVLSRIRSIESLQSSQSLAIGKIEVKLDYADRLETKIERLDSRIPQIEDSIRALERQGK